MIYWFSGTNFIILGANIGTCVTALLACVGANANSKRDAFIHFTFNIIGTLIFALIIWIFKDSAVSLLTSMFPGNDPMSLQMRVSFFHVVFNVTTTCILLPFVNQLVRLSKRVIKDKSNEEITHSLKYIDERLLSEKGTHSESFHSSGRWALRNRCQPLLFISRIRPGARSRPSCKCRFQYCKRHRFPKGITVSFKEYKENLQTYL